MTVMEYNVVQIQADAAGVEFYCSQYKPFRLKALQTDAKCKSSH